MFGDAGHGNHCFKRAARQAGVSGAAPKAATLISTHQHTTAATRRSAAGSSRGSGWSSVRSAIPGSFQGLAQNVIRCSPWWADQSVLGKTHVAESTEQICPPCPEMVGQGGATGACAEIRHGTGRSCVNEVPNPGRRTLGRADQRFWKGWRDGNRLRLGRLVKNSVHQPVQACQGLLVRRSIT